MDGRLFSVCLLEVVCRRPYCIMYSTLILHPYFLLSDDKDVYLVIVLSVIYLYRGTFIILIFIGPSETL